ncbi:MAG: hypothetical protein HGB11_00700 [Chlorobiales bacterium]|nr:hypothetical protein [Chlorobiales bacterium]
MKVKYIPDEAINLLDGEKDLLGTGVYVATLSDLIETTRTPFTIGLLGSWGSGKSSIVRTVKEKFEKDEQKRVRFFIYDAWKYSKDSFKRTFILELKKFFKLDAKEELDSFYRDKHTEISTQVKANKGFWLYLPIVIAFSIFLFSLVKALSDRDLVSGLVSILSVFIGLILFLLKEAFSQYKVSVTTPRTFASEQFEEIFGEIIDNVLCRKRPFWRWIKEVTGQSPTNKIIIAIDNIDRCNEDLAFELLITIKNFLEHEGVIFLLPVDGDGLKKYLKMGDKEADEFLRKMFNTTLRIKSFSPGELYDLASQLNTRYDLGLAPEVLSIICQEYSKNPRRIIQSFNTLQTEIALSAMQEERGLIAKGVISGNLLMLTRLLIIREEWPDFYARIADNPHLLKEIDEGFRIGTAVLVEDAGNKHIIVNRLPVPFSEEQYRFFMRTHQITAANLEAFFITKDVLRDIPDKVEVLVLSQDWLGLKKLINDGELSFEDLLDFIAKKIDTEIVVRKLMNTSGYNLLSLIFKIGNDAEFLTKFDVAYNSEFFRQIKILFEKQEMTGLIRQFDSDGVTNFSKWLHKKGCESLCDRIVESIDNSCQPDEVPNPHLPTIKAFVAVYRDTPAVLSKIKRSFSAVLSLKPELYESFKQDLNTKEIVQSLLSTNVCEAYINSLDASLKDENKHRVTILKDLNTLDILDSGLVANFCSRVAAFVQPTSDLNILRFWLEALEGFVEKNRNEAPRNVTLTILRNKHSSFLQQYNAGQTSELPMYCYLAFLCLSKESFVAFDKTNDEPVTWLNRFFDVNRSATVYLAVNNLYIDIIGRFEAFSWGFSQNVIAKFANINDVGQRNELAKTLNLMLGKSREGIGLSKEQINSILDNYFKLFLAGNQDANKWLLEVMKSDYLKKFIIEKLAAYTQIEHQRKSLEIVIQADDEGLIRDVVKNVLNSAQASNFKDNIDAVKFALDGRAALLKSILSDFLRGIKSDVIEQHKDFLDFFVSSSELLNGNEELVVEKLRLPLVSETLSRQMFSVRLLAKMDNFPPTTKSVIKDMSKNINEDGLSDADKDALKKVRGRLA